MGSQGHATRDLTNYGVGRAPQRGSLLVSDVRAEVPWAPSSSEAPGADIATGVL